MGINANQFRKYVVEPACDLLGLRSVEAVEMLMETAAQESGMGGYLHQLGNGPALGPFQMEPATYKDLWVNFLAYKKDLSEKIIAHWPQPNAELMTTDLLFAAVMCRIHYRRVKPPIPAQRETRAMYWKQFYNTLHGRGTIPEYLENSRRYIDNV